MMHKLLNILLYVFRITGVDPRYQNAFSILLQISCWIGLLLLHLTYVIEIAFNWQGVKTLATVYMYPAVCMFTLKTATLQFKKKNLMEIIRKIQNLYEFDKYEEDVRKRLQGIFRLARNFTVMFFSMCTLAMVVFSVTPFMTADPSLYFDAYWYCDKSQIPCFIVYFIWQHYLLLFLCFPNVITFDCLFIYLIAEVYCSIELTKHSLKELNVETYSVGEIDEFVRQHNRALDYIKELNRFYSKLMLAQAWFSLGALILSLYVMTSEGIPPPLPLLVKFGLLYVIFASQFSIYCFGGNVIMEQSKTVAGEAFGVDWWSETRPELRRSLVLIIQRSQKVEKISVGNIMDLNLECFVSVLKNSLSVYTLLLTMEKKANMLNTPN